ncbi:hypothetical protein CIPAW_01G100900 [Carya illinoinensis]|uniref:Uncharacterized protein n=1 Tax=Carya illinoinensis TaxID=32201 RepID=A0A8T1RL85_CARIL|nr:hypothetical protein CIPAW_01G100900 [Carya illinoinensis]
MPSDPVKEIRPPICFRVLQFFFHSLCSIFSLCLLCLWFREAMLCKGISCTFRPLCEATSCCGLLLVRPHFCHSSAPHFGTTQGMSFQELGNKLHCSLSLSLSLSLQKRPSAYE